MALLLDDNSVNGWPSLRAALQCAASLLLPISHFCSWAALQNFVSALCFSVPHATNLHTPYLGLANPALHITSRCITKQHFFIAWLMEKLLFASTPPPQGFDQLFACSSNQLENYDGVQHRKLASQIMLYQ